MAVEFISRRTVYLYALVVLVVISVNWVSGHPSSQDFSPDCSGHGILKSGICECDESYFGRLCECYR